MTRQCGSCTLCCKLVPVKELAKGAGERCKHQSAAKGCAIYHQPKLGFPISCALWSCRWLTGDDTADLRRPDRSRYVIDIMPDFVTLQDNDTGKSQQIPVVQVWLDPNYPDAHRDPALRAFMERRATENGMATILRWDNERAFTIFPPALAADGEWHEVNSGVVGETHTAAQVAEVLGSQWMVEEN